jgi:hypothetical protein
MCASSCIFVLIGAVHRDIQGKVGIHRPYFEIPKQAISREAVKSAYEQGVQRLREYIREMGVSDRLADSMMAISPEKMRYLSRADLEGYGVLEFDPTWKETIDVREAQKYGLTRREYSFRRAHAQKSCARFDCYDKLMKQGQ